VVTLNVQGSESVGNLFAIENRYIVLTALISGSSGRIGTALQRYLISQGWFIYELTSSKSRNQSSVKSRIFFDWNNPINFECPKVDVIFHLAAQTSAYHARDNVRKDVENNLLSSVEIVESARKSNVEPLMVFASTMSIYGSHPNTKINESFLSAPSTFYEVGKLSVESYLEQSAREGWLSKFISLRLANVYGGVYEKNSNPHRGFIDKSIQDASLGRDLVCFGTGAYNRDFLHVDDAVSAFSAAFDFKDTLNEQVYNIGTGTAHTVEGALVEIQKLAFQKTGLLSNIVHNEFPNPYYLIEKRDSLADSELFRTLTGWSYKLSLIEGINKILEQNLSLKKVV
jgi:nucleoside-diphosphate-sugar epimerase